MSVSLSNIHTTQNDTKLEAPKKFSNNIIDDRINDVAINESKGLKNPLERPGRMGGQNGVQLKPCALSPEEVIKQLKTLSDFKINGAIQMLQLDKEQTETDDPDKKTLIEDKKASLLEKITTLPSDVNLKELSNAVGKDVSSLTAKQLQKFLPKEKDEFIEEDKIKIWADGIQVYPPNEPMPSATAKVQDVAKKTIESEDNNKETDKSNNSFKSEAKPTRRQLNRTAKVDRNNKPDLAELIANNRKMASFTPPSESMKPNSNNDKINSGNSKPSNSPTKVKRPNIDGTDDSEDPKELKVKSGVQKDKPGDTPQINNEKLMSKASENSSKAPIGNQKKFQKEDIEKFEKLATKNLSQDKNSDEFKEFKSMFKSAYVNGNIKNLSNILIDKAMNSNDLDRKIIRDNLKHIILDEKKSGLDNANLKTLSNAYSQILEFSLSPAPSYIPLPPRAGELEGLEIFKNYLSSINIDSKTFKNLVKIAGESENSLIFYTSEGLKVMDLNEAAKISPPLRMVESTYMKDYFKDQKMLLPVTSKLISTLSLRESLEDTIRGLKTSHQSIDNMIFFFKEMSNNKPDEIYNILQNTKKQCLKTLNKFQNLKVSSFMELQAAVSTPQDFKTASISKLIDEDVLGFGEYLKDIKESILSKHATEFNNNFKREILKDSILKNAVDEKEKLVAKKNEFQKEINDYKKSLLIEIQKELNLSEDFNKFDEQDLIDLYKNIGVDPDSKIKTNASNIAAMHSQIKYAYKVDLDNNQIEIINKLNKNHWDKGSVKLKENISKKEELDKQIILAEKKVAEAINNNDVLNKLPKESDLKKAIKDFKEQNFDPAMVPNKLTLDQITAFKNI